MSISPLELLVPIAIITCGIGLVAADRAGFKTRYWGYALCCLGTGYASMLFQLSRISVLKQVAEDIFIMMGVALGSTTLDEHYGIVPRRFFHLTITVITALTIIMSLLMFQSVRLETLFTQIGCTMMLWPASLTSLRRSRSTADKILAMTFLFLSLALTGQCLFYFVAPEGPHQIGAWRMSIWGSVVQYTGLLGSIILAFAVMVSNSMSSIEKHRAHAGTDALTGLLNRRGLDMILASPSGGRFKNVPTAVILADIDHFKEINDRFGHLFGDNVIARFADLLRAHAGADALAARFGGEEFIVLLSNSRLQQAAALADLVRHDFGSQPWPEQQDAVSVTASFGVTLTRVGETLSGAIDRADRLLYAAKQGGRNCTAFGDDEASIAGHKQVPAKFDQQTHGAECHEPALPAR